MLFLLSSAPLDRASILFLLPSAPLDRASMLFLLSSAPLDRASILFLLPSVSGNIFCVSAFCVHTSKRVPAYMEVSPWSISFMAISVPFTVISLRSLFMFISSTALVSATNESSSKRNSRLVLASSSLPAALIHGPMIKPR